jgi:hypothetical protein
MADTQGVLRNLRSVAEQINMQRIAGCEPFCCTAQLDGRDLEWLDAAVAFLKEYQLCGCGMPDKLHRHDKHGIHCPRLYDK